MRPEPAAQLAALRIVVPTMILATPEVRHAAALAAVPAALRVAPEGLGWFVAWVPVHPVVAGVVQAIAVFSALCAIAGLRARVALAVLTGSAFYLFALSQLSGAVWHDMHLLWMSALLAASPCDEAWAFDRCGEPAPADSERYGWALGMARLQLAAVYFFPGLHKLLTSGLAWALSDNLRNQLWWKWAEHGAVPAFRVDHHPALLTAAALFVLGFELSFPVLALVPRTRAVAAVAGLAFHLCAAFFLRIPFVSLWATYVVLVDPRRLVPRWWRRPPAASVAAPPPLRSTVVVGAALFAAIVVQGLRGQTRAFPFACYPTFEWMAPTVMPDLEIEAETADGRAVLLPHARDAHGYRTQRQWGEIWSLAGATSPVDPARLRAYLDWTARTEPARSIVAGATRIRFYRVYRAVVPEQRGWPPVARVEITP
ncbi:MAG TPA: HTTM domain-containing protein [Polyangiaceae bacterium]